MKGAKPSSASIASCRLPCAKSTSSAATLSPLLDSVTITDLLEVGRTEPFDPRASAWRARSV